MLTRFPAPLLSLEDGEGAGSSKLPIMVFPARSPPSATSLGQKMPLSLDLGSLPGTRVKNQILEQKMLLAAPMIRIIGALSQKSRAGTNIYPFYYCIQPPQTSHLSSEVEREGRAGVEKGLRLRTPSYLRGSGSVRASGTVANDSSNNGHSGDTPLIEHVHMPRAGLNSFHASSTSILRPPRAETPEVNRGGILPLINW